MVRPTEADGTPVMFPVYRHELWSLGGHLGDGIVVARISIEVVSTSAAPLCQSVPLYAVSDDCTVC